MVTYDFVNGTIANADEVNQNFKDNWSELASYATTGEFNSLSQSFCASIPCTRYVVPTYTQSDVMTDTSGYLDTVNIDNCSLGTDAAFGGTNCLNNHYYGEANYFYDEFYADCSLDLTKWNCSVDGNCGTPGTVTYGSSFGVASTGNLAVSASTVFTGNGFECAESCSLLLDLGDAEKVDVCYCGRAGGTGGLSGTLLGCVQFQYGGNTIVNFSKGASGLTQCTAKWTFCRLNANCVDYYKNDVCTGQLTTTCDEVYLKSCHAVTGYSSGSTSACSQQFLWDMLITDGSSGSRQVKANPKDYGEQVDWVYANADTELDAGTCVTYDVINADTDATIISNCPLNEVADISDSNVCNIRVNYNLCSTTVGNCACMKKYSYIVTTK